MKIEELVLRGFGKWQDATFRFAPGINLFYAPNESGKSTILQGIFAALYGMKRDYVKSARYLPEYEKYRPWQSGSYETIISYKLAGKTYRLHRQLTKEREEARLFLDPEWTEMTDLYLEDRRKERNFIEKHTGLTRSLFTDLTWIRREPLQAAEHLIPTFTTAEEANPAVQQILAELDREVALIGKKERAENTLLGKAATKVAQKEQEKESAKAAWRTISQLTLQIAEATEECQQLEQRRSRLQQRLERSTGQAKALQERWQRSHAPVSQQDWAWWEQTARSEAELAIHEEARRGFTHVNMPTDAVQQGDERLIPLQHDYEKGTQWLKQREALHVRLATLAVSALSTSPRSTASRSSRQGNQAKRKRGAVLMWGGAGILSVLGGIGFVSGHPVLGGISVTAALLLFGFGVFLLRVKGSTVGAKQAADHDTVQESQRVQEEIASLDAELATLVQRWGASNWDTFLERREELLKSTRKQQSEQLLSEMAKTKQEADLSASWGEALRTLLDQEKNALETEQGKLRIEMVEIEERLQELREQIARGNGEMAVHESLSLARATDELEEAQAALRQLQNKRDALQLAREMLQESVGEWRRDSTPAVNQQASEIIEHITGGAYRDVRLDPRDGFAVRLLEPTKQMVLEQDQCSTGTIDQLYLAQRLALVHHAKQSEPLPLFFDDHFVHYDDERLRRTLDYIAMLAQEQQVFLFTCHERELRMLAPLLRQGNRHAVHRIG
ncbi:ATP-binding protein [Brevibacillus sp. MS2.2]|uniref:ATP-binding protein n=1 Tax=Brevibacillus sp. MS2.2 TaxID=2738981 RepID=UPI00156AFC83|nr:AAA family ATPase [Brevibacillus sp. MS2.2]NRR21407.1 AAA family ATPase [Brevibacillus sp. MS2.2]